MQTKQVYYTTLDLSQKHFSVRQFTITGNLKNKLQTGIFVSFCLYFYPPPLSVFSFRQNQCPFIGGNAGQNTSGSSIKHAKNQSSKSDEFGLKTG